MTFSYHDITEFYVFVTNSKGKIKMDLYIFLGMCTELMNTTYEAADHTVYLSSVKMTIAERENEYNAFCQICENLGYELETKKTSGGYYSLWFMELKELNLKIVYDFGCYLEAPEEND